MSIDLPLGQEQPVDHIIAHLLALCYAFTLVERPVDAEIDAALTVLFFCLRQGREARPRSFQKFKQ
jgi:hypothetical protein